jgi:hypothetical protein
MDRTVKKDRERSIHRHSRVDLGENARHDGIFTIPNIAPKKPSQMPKKPENPHHHGILAESDVVTYMYPHRRSPIATKSGASTAFSPIGLSSDPTRISEKQRQHGILAARLTFYAFRPLSRCKPITGSI